MFDKLKRLFGFGPKPVVGPAPKRKERLPSHIAVNTSSRAYDYPAHHVDNSYLNTVASLIVLDELLSNDEVPHQGYAPNESKPAEPSVSSYDEVSSRVDSYTTPEPSYTSQSSTERYTSDSYSSSDYSSSSSSSSDYSSSSDSGSSSSFD